jgi:hypothetical protein
MPIHFDCEYCGDRMEAPGGLAGGEMDCPSCGETGYVPGPADEGPPLGAFDAPGPDWGDEDEEG